MRVVDKVRDELIPANDPYPLPSKSGTYDVSPEMASSWFSYRRHPKLRPFSPSTAARYQADMESVPRRWREDTPEGLIFDTDGWIISAQHRLKAQANAGVTLRWRIFVGEPRDIGPFLDQGRRRSAADMLMVKYGVQVGAGARHLAALADADRWGMPRYNAITIPEVVEAYGQWPELTWHLTEVMACKREALVPAGPHLAVLAQASRTGHRDLIPTWLQGVCTGEDLSHGDPRLHLRRRFGTGLPAGKGKREHAYGLLVKAWNAYVAGEFPTVLKYMSTEPLPQVVGFSMKKAEGKAA